MELENNTSTRGSTPHSPDGGAHLICWGHVEDSDSTPRQEVAFEAFDKVLEGIPSPPSTPDGSEAFSQESQQVISTDDFSFNSKVDDICLASTDRGSSWVKPEGVPSLDFSFLLDRGAQGSQLGPRASQHPSQGSFTTSASPISKPPSVLKQENMRLYTQLEESLAENKRLNPTVEGLQSRLNEMNYLWAEAERAAMNTAIENRRLSRQLEEKRRKESAGDAQTSMRDVPDVSARGGNLVEEGIDIETEVENTEDKRNSRPGSPFPQGPENASANPDEVEMRVGNNGTWRSRWIKTSAVGAIGLFVVRRALRFAFKR